MDATTTTTTAGAAEAVETLNAATDPWVTSALPDGWVGAVIECLEVWPDEPPTVYRYRWDGETLGARWDVTPETKGAWASKRMASGDPCLGRLPSQTVLDSAHDKDEGLLIRWRWVTRPASEASEPEQEVCWLCSPDECDCPCGATNDAQAPLAKPTGLSREGVARERRESWRLGSREELIAKVETERGYVRDLMGQMRRLRTALGLPADTFDEVTVSRAICAVESRFEARFAEASARAGWVQAEQERDEARDALERMTAERDAAVVNRADETQRAEEYAAALNAQEGHPQNAAVEVLLLTQERDEARAELAEFNGTPLKGWRDQCISLRAELAALRQVGRKMGNERNEARDELNAEREAHGETRKRGARAAEALMAERVDGAEVRARLAKVSADLGREREEHAESVKRLRAEHEAQTEDQHQVVQGHFDAIAELCGCPEWGYFGQVVRDVRAMAEEHAGTVTANEDLQAENTRLTAILSGKADR